MTHLRLAKPGERSNDPHQVIVDRVHARLRLERAKGSVEGQRALIEKLGASDLNQEVLALLENELADAQTAFDALHPAPPQPEPQQENDDADVA